MKAYDDVRSELISLAEEDYKKFSSSLIPGDNKVLGVRLTKLRKMAREISKGDWRLYLKNANSYYFEERMLQGMVIGYAKADIEEILKYVMEFLPKINNWSLCDSFCSSLKITKDNTKRVFEFLKPYFTSKEEYYVRFAFVMAINYFLTSDYIDYVLNFCDKEEHEGYYVKMAVSWTISICFGKFPHKTMKYLKNNNLDDFTYNKALQKITESSVVSKEDKIIIRAMKRNKAIV